ncbi:MAG: ABC transporter permease [Rouxiella aceris]|uniref:ABC transporter permease n=1 Tax=Rouxiella aceris TaxID=2703884 RepID=UPI0028443FD3|nr:ABC transporter permease [Rouxiella aceris]MDR3432894.1 ABC transporter permease [Rouxiella aceris]
MKTFSCDRVRGLVVKELQELCRDYVSLTLILLIPLIQLLIYGFAVNTDVRQLPTVLINNDSGYLSRSFVQGMVNTDYFDILPGEYNEQQAQRALLQGKASFVITIPSTFTRQLLRGEVPDLLVQADAVDAVTINNAVNAMQTLPQYIIAGNLPGGLRSEDNHDKININVQKMFNPELIEQFNFIPAVCICLLNSVLVLMSSLSIIKEKETGALENMLVYPISPLEFIIGKMAPYAIIGIVEAALIFSAAFAAFRLPFLGSIVLLVLVILIFIIISLTIGVIISSISKTQLQAMQFSITYFLPSIMLSGFISPFQGMPHWAQLTGKLLPSTYLMRISREIIIKGVSFADILPDVLALMAMMLILLALALYIKRRTLD